MMSKVPRPFGELTHPSWRPEDVAFVVLAAIASPRYRLKMKERCAIAACAAHCPPATRDLGIIAYSSCSSLRLLTLPTTAASIRVRKAFVSSLGAWG